VETGQSGSRAEGVKFKMAPCHKIIHNFSRKRATEMILVSLHRFWRSSSSLI